MISSEQSICYWVLIREGKIWRVKILKNLNVDLYEIRKEVEVGSKGQNGEKYCQY